MKLPKLNTKNLNLSPKSLFRSKKSGSSISKSDPSSFSLGAASSSSDSSESVHKPGSGLDLGTPTSVLPEISGEWSDSSGDVPAHGTFELLQAFKLIDRDNDGVVSREDLEALFSLLGAKPASQEEVAMMLREVGCDGNGCISLEELTTKVGSACGPACDAELRETFEFFDKDHDGKITAEELLGVFEVMGDARCTLEDCRRMIAGVAKNGDGFVCFADFCVMMEQQR